jgi:abnormal spindle-like microcephaly-associated protein
MHRYAAGTPCPAPAASFSHDPYHDYARPSSLYAPDDTTANIDFTREIHTKPSHAKPRRPMRAVRQAAFNPSLDIFQDVAQAEEHEMKRTTRTTLVPESSRTTRSTILAHPAHKISAHKLARPAPSLQETEPQRSKVQRRRVSQVLRDRESPNVNATLQLQEESLQKKELRKQGPKKDPRRRTIYVPSDDTTMMTIHPGQSTSQPRKARETSPNIGLDLVTLSEEDDASLVSALKKERGVSGKSLAMPPKRGPLTTSARSLQAVSFSSDILGSGDGKENVPPGMEVKAKKITGTHIEINFPKADTKRPVSKTLKADSHISRRSDVSKRTETSRRPEVAQTRMKQEGSAKRLREQVSYERVPVKSIKARSDITASAAASAAASAKAAHKAAIKNAKPKVSRVRPAQMSSSPFHTDRTPPAALRRHRAERTSGKITMMHIVGKPQQEKKEKYPVLEEDLARPEMYEENWLTYQEIAITQLLNSMFDSAHKNPNAEESPEDLRKKMLAIYHGPAMPPLHKRLQASLQFGALSIPKDLLAQTLRLKDDVGLRKKFLNLWTKSYDLNALRAAAETIFGRQINTPSRLSTGSTMSDDGSRVFRAERRAIEHFLDAFLIKNEDAVRIKSGVGSIASIARGEDDFGSQGWSWRRTVLRSLMLVLVLDQAKATDVLPGCLFQSTSPYKTSVDILHQLSTMLLPSHGDITRPLGHLTYKVEHVQYPLQEYTYHIDNIAIDLRDGIVLTRLVELLLYPAATLVEQQEDTVTISMPSGEVLTSSFDFSQKESWVLSQHLKFPAIGRPQKMYNVQIALAALSGVRGLPGQAAGGVKAEEIVDGHREKTLSLLWSLVGKCGLGSLVDWPQIVKETERFRDQWHSNRDSHEEHDLDSDSDSETTELSTLNYHKRLLLSWARAITRLHGFRIANLTTSFADSKVLEVIVDTYLPSTLLASTTTSTTTLTLPAKLSTLGCSAPFIALFTPHHTTARSIPSQDFTLLTLAFLASRLLPLSLTHRAAATIQRAYRARLARHATRKRIAALKTARECAAVAQERIRLVHAATVLQRRWRAVCDARRAALERDVGAFQALARAWAVRRWARRVTGGRVGGREKSRRVRGGW